MAIINEMNQAAPSNQSGTNQEPADFEPTNNQGGTEEVTPELQEAYDRTVMGGMAVLFDDPMHDSVIKMLNSGADNPAKTLADVTAMIILQLDEKSGGEIPEDVILPAAEEILSQAAELAGNAKIFEVNDQVISVASEELVTQLAAHYDPDGLQELTQSVGQEKAGQMVSDHQRIRGA